MQPQLPLPWACTVTAVPFAQGSISPSSTFTIPLAHQAAEAALIVFKVNYSSVKTAKTGFQLLPSLSEPPLELQGLPGRRGSS